MSMAFTDADSRLFRLDGASNFRDAGGYASAHGGHVQTGRLFRSDHLAALSEQDLALLRSLDISCALDFRGAHERERSPYQYEFLTYHALSVEPTIVQDLGQAMQSAQGLSAKQAQAIMERTYTQFVQQHSGQFARVFEQLLHTPQNIVLHCTAGKDRTGFAVALIHHALGVQYDDIMQDYLLSGRYFKRPDLPDNRGLDEDVLNVVWGVQAEFLEAAFQEIKRVYGSVDAYLAQALGLSPEQRSQLQALYLV